MAVTAQAKLIEALLAASLPPGLSLGEREITLIAYAEKLTLAPATIQREDIDRLRAVGLDDLAIHDTCAIVAYFGFVNRIADGLGVEIETG